MTPLVFLPGMMCDARLFGPQVATLSGRRAIHHAPMVAADDVDDLAAVILAGAPPRFALAGLSMGGIVALAMLAQAAGRIERLALLDTNPLMEAPERSARREPQIAAVRSGGLATVMRDELIPGYRADGPVGQEMLELCLDMALRLGPDVFELQSRALQRRPDRRELLSTIRVPTLVLCGLHDRLCPVERHRMMADLVPSSRLEIVEGAGHMPTLDRPDITTAALVRWLEFP